jgi:hypothetical protein
VGAVFGGVACRCRLFQEFHLACMQISAFDRCSSLFLCIALQGVLGDYRDVSFHPWCEEVMTNIKSNDEKAKSNQASEQNLFFPMPSFFLPPARLCRVRVWE